VALWKDPERGTREISLEPGAQGVILTLVGDRATRRSADGRWPVDTGTRYFDAAVHQIRASTAGSGSANWRPGAQTRPVLEADELTIITGWAEGVAEALAYTPDRALSVLADAHPGASWRAPLGIPEPSPRVRKAIDSLCHAVIAATPPGHAPTFGAVLAAARADKPDENALSRLVRRALRSSLEQLRTRQAKDASR
jgi:hypothetical protein